MKGTEHFAQTISSYLDKREAEDPQFSIKRRAINRPIEDIVTFILNEVKASGCNGFSDAEIFGMAVHAAEEPDINIGSKVNCQVVVNHHVELTAKEKEEQRQKALRQFREEELRKIKERNKPKTATKTKSNAIEPQLSLFDF